MKTAVRRTVIAAAAVVLGLGIGTTAQATPAAPGSPQTNRPVTSPLPVEVLAALQHDLHLTADQVTREVAQQVQGIEINRALRATLGSAFGGSWFAAGSNRLVVAVSQPQRVAEVTVAGAGARLVRHSEAELAGIKARLDGLAGIRPDRGTRARAGERQAAVAGLTAWRVDPVTNAVVVTVRSEGAGTAAMRFLAGYGDAVRVEVTSIAPTATAVFLDGGDAINSASCSAGFNLRNPSTGQGYLLTAGHCVTAGSTVRGQDGVAIGPVLERWFPTFDDALVRNDNPGYWIQGPWVDTNPSNGGVIVVSNTYSDSPVGTDICKSGIRTKLTCGRITGKDETVIFDGVNTVLGLTRHSACVMRGDSGGSNYRVAGNSPEGVTSGAHLYGADGHCGNGSPAEPTISWYYPIADSLAYYGPRYGLRLW